MMSNSDDKVPKCILRSSNEAYPNIEVGLEKVFIGRTRECRIQSLHCSKKQSNEDYLFIKVRIIYYYFKLFIFQCQQKLV